MAQEIKLVWNPDEMEADIVTEYGDVVKEDGLETALILSLFVDRRANDDDILPDPDSTDKRGWWGDQINPYIEGDQIGSRLWLLKRSKTTDENLVRAKEYAMEAIQWLVEDGVAAKVEVTTERIGDPGEDKLAMEIKVLKIDGTTIAKRYELQWEGQFD